MSIHSEITSTIIAQIEAGVAPWAASWDQAGSNARPLRANGQGYNGINVVLLWSSAQQNGFQSPRWLTFNQAKELGGCVRKGSKGTKIVYYSSFTKEADTSKGETEDQNIPFLKTFTVFNSDQIDGLPEKYCYQARTDTKAERIEAADAFLLRTGVELRHGGGRAFYSHGHDFVQMPEIEKFDSAEAYCATLAHEMIHSTGHKDRLAREYGKKFGDNAYAIEELVAEMGAAFVMADLGLSAEPRADHAQYLASWLKVLKADPKALFTAASAASKACDKLGEMVAAYVEPVAPAPAPTKPAKRQQRVSSPVVVPMSPRKPQPVYATAVAAELTKPVRLNKRSNKYGQFLVHWADGTQTRVRGALWVKDSEKWAGAYQAADRLRRLRARHTMQGLENKSEWMAFGACGIVQLSGSYWDRVRAYPMAAPVLIQYELDDGNPREAYRVGGELREAA
jgi:antirestriction protein ArdC